MRLIETSVAPLTSDGAKTLSGLFAETNTFNQNGRTYPESIYDEAYEELIPKIAERRLLGELDHPIDYDEIRLSNVSHAITDCHSVEEDGVKKYYGTVELLDTPAGMIAQALVKAGIPLGISSRGLGSTKQVRDGVEVTSLKLITFDLVAEPSFANAVLSPDSSKELSDSLHYIESRLPLNESVETSSIRDQINQIRESLNLRETDSKVNEDIRDEEIKGLKSLVESSRATIKSDTKVLRESRRKIKALEEQLSKSAEDYAQLLERLEELQEAYNKLADASDNLSEAEDELISLRKSLAVEKRGMSYNRVSELLEGATTTEEIESRLDSLSSYGKYHSTPVNIRESIQTVNKPKKLSGLAAIVSRV